MGFLRGYGIFDFMRTRNGRLFLFKEHFKKLKQASKYLELKLPLKEKQLEQVIYKLIKKNSFKESAIKIVLTGGNSGSMYFSEQPTFLILVDELHKKPEVIYKKGVKLISVDYQRVPFEVKILNYIVAVKAQNTIVKKEKAFEVLYFSKGFVLESATSNFFILKNNTLITPKNNIFKGVTRNLVIKFAKKKFKVIERDIRIKELASADEVFITGSSKEIVPVVKVDKLVIGNGNVGENTKELIKIFGDYINNY